MNILVNGQPADIKLENEKNVGELLAGIEDWLEGTGNRMSGLVIDGAAVQADCIEQAFKRDLQSIQSIDIHIHQWIIFAMEALTAANDALKQFETASFENKKLVQADFEADAAFRFLKEQIPDMADIISASLAGEGLSASEAIKLIAERLREIETPVEEVASCNTLVSEIVSRLEDIPLDMQTGKDKRAMETIRLFSHIVEKLFRLLSLLKQHGFETNDIIIDSVPIQQFMESFLGVLQELLKASEVKDTVLTGDLAEYEMAPRLTALYSAMKKI